MILRIFGFQGTFLLEFPDSRQRITAKHCTNGRDPSQTMPNFIQSI
jgi:hypothetical protein